MRFHTRLVLILVVILVAALAAMLVVALVRGTGGNQDTDNSDVNSNDSSSLVQPGRP